MKFLFSANPISGGVDKEPFLDAAAKYCKKHALDHEIFRTTGDEDREQLKEVIQSYKPDRVAAVGGDGTVLFTAIALLDSGIPMGIIPLG